MKKAILAAMMMLTAISMMAQIKVRANGTI